MWRRGYKVRSLVKLGRYAEALKAAEAIESDGQVPYLKMLVHASKGDVDRVMELAGASLRNDYDIEDCYRNEDLGPLLRGERFARFRERFPEKKGLDRFNDDD